MIIRSGRKIKFTIISNEVLEDSELDWKDLGLLCYLLSKPDNWKISVEHLCKQRKLGRDGLYNCLNTIIAAGYAARSKQKDGTVIWAIFDEKQTSKQDKAPDTGKTEEAVESQIRKIPITENPNRENPTLVNTDNKQILNSLVNTEIFTTEKSSQEWFTEFYTAYPKKKAKDDAIRAWKKIKPELFEMIITDVINRTANDSEWLEGFAPYPATYLNGKRWNDEISLSKPKKNNVHHINYAEQREKKIAESINSTQQPNIFGENHDTLGLELFL
jgi:hypothetical protein